MKIAIFADNFYPELSGLADSAIALGKEMADRGHMVHFYAPKYSKKNFAFSGLKPVEINLGPNVKVYRIFSFPFSAPTMQGRAAIPNIFSLIFMRKRYDVIHVHSFFGTGIYGALMAKRTKTALVGTNHTIIEAFLDFSPIKSEWFKKSIIRYVKWFYSKCDYLSVPSDFMKSHMTDQEKKLEHATVISNPIEEGFFFKETDNKQTLKNKLGLGKNVILYVGAFSNEKKVKNIFEAFLILTKKNKESELVLLGQGILRGFIEKWIKEKNLIGRVKIVGPFLGSKKAELYDYFKSADIFCLTSYPETQSMAVLQAMAGGVPCVVPDIGAPKDLVGNDRGLTFKHEDISDLKDKIEYLVKDIKKREEFGKNARIFAEKYSTKNIANEWEREYRRLAGHAGKQFKISLVIPAHNEEKYIGACLEHALKNSNGKFHEIIVIDNVSTDKTKEIASKFPGVRVVYEKEKGLTKARQRGFVEATGDILAYIDADTRMPEGWYGSLEDHFLRYPELVCFSGPYFYHDIPKLHQRMIKFYWYALAVPTYLFVGYMTVGGNFAIKKETLEKMGGFDTSIAFYGEDSDISRRANQFGKVKFSPNFIMPSSGRRIEGEGIFMMMFTYILNYFSQVLAHKSITKKYRDIR